MGDSTRDREHPAAFRREAAGLFLAFLARSSRSHGNSAHLSSGGFPTSAAIANASAGSGRRARTASRARPAAVAGAWLSGMPDFLLLLWDGCMAPVPMKPSFTG